MNKKKVIRNGRTEHFPFLSLRIQSFFRSLFYTYFCVTFVFEPCTLFKNSIGAGFLPLSRSFRFIIIMIFSAFIVIIYLSSVNSHFSLRI